MADNKSLAHPGDLANADAATPGGAATWDDAIGEDRRLAAFDPTDAETARIVCAMHGHAVVEQGFFGYWHCDRCGAQVGDSLGGCYTPKTIRGHDCEQCRAAWVKAGFWGRLGVLPAGGGFLQQRDAFAEDKPDDGDAEQSSTTDAGQASGMTQNG